MTEVKDQSCESRIAASMESTLEDLRKLWEAYCDGDEDRYSEDLGNIFEYGLCFDYVAPETFTDQRIGYFRYQISWGGPSDEFRFYTDKIGRILMSDFTVDRIEYWFLDWFDGAHSDLSGEDFKLLDEIFDSLFKDTGTVEKVYNDAMAE